jgi:hypothetical protein
MQYNEQQEMLSQRAIPTMYMMRIYGLDISQCDLLLKLVREILPL